MHYIRLHERTTLTVLVVALLAWSVSSFAEEGDRRSDLLPTGRPEVIAGLLEFALQTDPAAASQTLNVLRDKSLSGELSDTLREQLPQRLQAVLVGVLSNPSHPAYRSAVLLAAAWGDAPSLQRAESWMSDRSLADDVRADAVRVVLARQNPPPVNRVLGLFAETATPMPLRVRLLQELSRLPQDRVAEGLLATYPHLPGELQARVIDTLTQRPQWALLLLDHIRQGRMNKDVLHAQQLVRLQASGNEHLREVLRQLYGAIRVERSPEREAVIRQVREFIRNHRGDPHRGWAVFRRVCAQCHRLYEEGYDVGPDITRNGRSSLSQLLSNVLDPNLVVGDAYQARIVVTSDGRIFTGLLAEESAAHLTLKLPGGKLEAIAKQDVETLEISPLSLMPEGLEKQLTLEELADLFAFLRLDKPPTDPHARLIPD